MTTKTRRKRPAKKSTGKPRRKVVASRKAPSTNGKSAGQSNKFAANQPPIKGMEDVDERITELDKECQSWLSKREQRKKLKTEMEEDLQEVGELLKEHDLNHYTMNGEKFYEEPGAPHIKVVKVKQRGE